MNTTILEATLAAMWADLPNIPAADRAAHIEAIGRLESNAR